MWFRAARPILCGSPALTSHAGSVSAGGVEPPVRPSTRLLPLPCPARPSLATPSPAVSVGAGESNPGDDHPPASMPRPALACHAGHCLAPPNLALTTVDCPTWPLPRRG